MSVILPSGLEGSQVINLLHSGIDITQNSSGQLVASAAQVPSSDGMTTPQSTVPPGTAAPLNMGIPLIIVGGLVLLWFLTR